MNRNERANTVFEAAKLNDYIFLSRLLSEGNDANERNEWGLTCLHICATCGSLECAKVLVAFGANLEVRDMESGWTALHRAFFFNQISMALFLMASGASLDSCEIVDHEGLTPLSLLSLLLKDSLEKSGNQSGVVVSFGKADYTLGIPLPKASEVLRPKVVESLLQDSIVDVQATKYHSYAITSAGLVYSWGHGKGGRLGHGDDKSRFEPTVISGLISIKIRKISASDSHALALTENGEIFSWGSNSLGQLGQGSGENSRLLSSPKRIESLRGVAVVGISAGENHSLCHTSSSELYGWGNNERGQLGVSITTGTNTVFIPKRISQASSSLLKQSSAKITQVLASSSCSMLLITSRQHGSDVLFWGNNSHFFRRVHFRRNVHPSDCSIVQLAAGNDIFFGISESGLVYSWHDENSSTIYSQSAKQEEINCTPRIIESLHPKNGGQKVVFISASHGRVCATSETGDLYSWSYANGKLESPPRKVHGVKGSKAVAVGSDHTLAVIGLSSPEFSLHPLITKASIPSLKALSEVTLIPSINVKNIWEAISFAQRNNSSILFRYCLKYIKMNFDTILVLSNPSRLQRYFDDHMWPETIDILMAKIAVQSKIILDTISTSGKLNHQIQNLKELPDATTISSIEELNKIMKKISKKLQAVALLQEKIKIDQVGTLSSEQLDKLENKNTLQNYYANLQQQMVRLQNREKNKVSYQHGPRSEKVISSSVPSNEIRSVYGAQKKDNPIQHSEPSSAETKSPEKTLISDSIQATNPLVDDCSVKNNGVSARVTNPWAQVDVFQQSPLNCSIQSSVLSSSGQIQTPSASKQEDSSMRFNLADYITPMRSKTQKKKQSDGSIPQSNAASVDSMSSKSKPWSTSNSISEKCSFSAIQEQEEKERLGSNVVAFKGNDVHWYVQRTPRAQSLESLMAEQERERQEELELELALKQIAEMEEREARKNVREPRRAQSSKKKHATKGNGQIK